jgi:serine/threonine protein kinase
MSIVEEVAKLERRRLAGEITQAEFEQAVASVAAGLRAPPVPPASSGPIEADTEITTDADLRVSTIEGVPDPFGGIPPNLPRELPPTIQTSAVPNSRRHEDEASGPARGVDPVPSRLGAYKLVELVGQGGMGLVYAAKHLVRPGLFALKVPRPSLAADPNFVRRFRREARVGLKLDHPGIVRVHDLIIDGEYPAMVMDFVTGANLDTLIRNSGGPLSLARTADLFGQILVAMAYAHDQGCIHRDLKPKNVIVKPDGKALVTDFGLARLTQGEATQTNMLLGTATYLAPEVYAAGAVAGPQSDIYALGMTLYKMLVGRPPFEPGTPAYVILKLKEAGEVPPPSSFVSTIPPAIDALVARAIEPDPRRRFKDCRTFESELRRVMRSVQGEATIPLEDQPTGPLQAEATLPFISAPAGSGFDRVESTDETVDETLDGALDDVFQSDVAKTVNEEPSGTSKKRRSYLAPTVSAPAVGRQNIRGPKPAITTKGRRIIGALAGLLLAAVAANLYLLMNEEAWGGGHLLGPGGDRFGSALSNNESRARSEAGLSADLPERKRRARAVAAVAAPGAVDWDEGGAPGSSVPVIEDSGPTAAEKGEQVREAVARKITAAAARNAVTRQHGIIYLSSSPVSRVEIDGIDYGSSEITRKGIPLPEGPHVVRFRCVSKKCQGLKVRGAKKTLTVEPGREMRFHADFGRLNARRSAEPSDAQATPAEGDAPK